MSSDDIVFNSSGLSIVDQWLAGSEDAPQATRPSTVSSQHKGSYGAASSSSSSSSPKTIKNGLGFLQHPKKNRNKDLKNKSGASAAGGASAGKGLNHLMERILAQKQQQGKKRARAERNDEGADSHGVGGAEEEDLGELHGVQEDFTQSRTTVQKRVMKTGMGIIPASDAHKKKKNKTQAAVATAGASGGSEGRAEEGNNAAKGKEKKVANTAPKQVSMGIKPGKGGYWAVVHDAVAPAAADAGGAGGAGADKPRRPKTRSKQKNIRKDNRPMEGRPDYRPLTAETKSRVQLINKKTAQHGAH